MIDSIRHMLRELGRPKLSKDDLGSSQVVSRFFSKSRLLFTDGFTVGSVRDGFEYDREHFVTENWRHTGEQYPLWLDKKKPTGLVEKIIKGRQKAIKSLLDKLNAEISKEPWRDDDEMAIVCLRGHCVQETVWPSPQQINVCQVSVDIAWKPQRIQINQPKQPPAQSPAPYQPLASARRH